MLEPRELLPIDNVHKIALTIELMRPLAVRQSLNQLFNVFVAFRNLVLDAGGIGRNREGVEPSYKGTRSTGSQRDLYPSYTNPVGQQPIGFTENPRNTLGFIVVCKRSLRNHRGDLIVLGFYYGSQGNVRRVLHT